MCTRHAAYDCRHDKARGDREWGVAIYFLALKEGVEGGARLLVQAISVGEVQREAIDSLLEGDLLEEVVF